MAAPSKSQLLDKIYPLLAKRYRLGPREAKLSVLEAVLFGICHEGTTREQANQVIGRFKDSFFDWNELRVSSVPEIQDALAGLPDAEEKAQRIRRFLRQLFSRTYKFDLDHLGKKPLKESIKSLQEFEATQSDYVLATVIQQALGGHAIPVDEPIRRCLVRLGFAEPDVTLESLRASLERAIPKIKGAEFADLLKELAQDTCISGEPLCPECVLVKLCPTGQERRSLSRPSPSATLDADTATTSRRRSTPQGDHNARPSRGKPSRPK